MSNIYDAIVVGGGYSGLVFAIYCARAQKKVIILEKNQLIGRKILSTGNGRCNFTNSTISSDFYYSESSLENLKFDYQKSVDFIHDLGVIDKDLNGFFYPITNQAKTIRDAFEIELKELGVEINLETQVASINKKDNIFTVVDTANNTYQSTNVIIATGGLAAPSLGSTGDGYKFAKNFNVSVTKTVPALVGLTSKDLKLKELAGVRTLGKVTICDHSFEGEIQFNKDSISGFPVMCLSRLVGFSDNSKLKISVDFVPFYNKFELEKELQKRIESSRNKTISQLLIGLINDKCIDVIIKNAKIDPTVRANYLTNKDVKAVVNTLKDMGFEITGTKGFDTAQVTAGGVSLQELDMDTMSCKKITGLYFVGEVVDVDGMCGGYNLEWARMSAEIAANDVINKERN